jgi:hypothetical protein
MMLVGLCGRGKWPFGALVLAERALCGDGGCAGFIGGDGTAAPIREEMDIVVPGRELKGGSSLEPT